MQTVTIVFSSFYTAYYNDYVYIYDGNNTSTSLLASLTGFYYSNLTYTTSQRFMFVRFTSSVSDAYSGFYASYMISLPPGYDHFIVLCGLYLYISIELNPPAHKTLLQNV